MGVITLLLVSWGHSPLELVGNFPVGYTCQDDIVQLVQQKVLLLGAQHTMEDWLNLQWFVAVPKRITPLSPPHDRASRLLDVQNFCRDSKASLNST